MKLKEIIKGFELYDQQELVGHIEFSQKDGIVKIISTKIREKYEGQGLGKQLVEATVAYAKENNYKIVPLCSYAVHVLGREQYSDILGS